MNHGTASAYGWHGCRCDDCRAWKAAANRRWHRGEVAYRLPPRKIDPDGVDEIAVERACHGDRGVRLNYVERHAAFAYLDAHGHGAREIAERIGVTSRTVQRWRAAQRVQPLLTSKATADEDVA